MGSSSEQLERFGAVQNSSKQRGNDAQPPFHLAARTKPVHCQAAEVPPCAPVIDSCSQGARPRQDDAQRRWPGPPTRTAGPAAFSTGAGDADRDISVTGSFRPRSER